MNSYFKDKGTNLSQHLQTSTDISTDIATENNTKIASKSPFMHPKT